MSTKKVVFQGEPGANSHIACNNVFPEFEALPMATFEDCFNAIQKDEADLGMIPVENSVAGRVADIHHLMPTSGLNIIGEYFLPIHHQLVGLRGTKLDEVESIQSHVMALGQCRKVIRDMGVRAVIGADTAGSARQIAEWGDASKAAISSDLAADIYDLDILKPNVEDEDHNTTRFIILSKYPIKADAGNGPVITTLVFRVRNVPAALFKAMGGFATNGVNMTKLESYQTGGKFFATQFYADIEGHPNDANVKLALEELEFFSAELKVLGVYPAHEYRLKIAEPQENRELRPSPGI
ncbi:prephenate dehydratase [Cohaesibacter gelatinilyticus]|uniref:prephenate dehydratase n=1 Tax=Cohaesibacter gelatinilyticus TaxID=372072 RepID=A0A285PHH8_9HYPH|nr:prephenate dehydratase [Cohaesibacter gelatinilyticus]SNZ20733.1 prephenate dehydratase [Cohaesibacter gelatinilyticus]